MDSPVFCESARRERIHPPVEKKRMKKTDIN
jgi:hypothetical protein